MAGIVAGNLGVQGSALTQLGLAGGKAATGQTAGKAYVNINTGNLSLQFLDEQLAGRGADFGYTRHNHGGLADLFYDGDKDGWTDGVQRVYNTTVPADPVAGSTRIIAVRSDGTYELATWDGSAYVLTNGAGAHDRITVDVANNEWIWTDGDTQAKEYIDISTGNIKRARDASGNGLDYSYYDSGDHVGRLHRVTDIGSGNTLLYSYSGGRISNVATQVLISNGSISNPIEQVSYTYDAQGRLEHVNTLLQPGNAAAGYYTTSYEYDGTSTRVSKVAQSDGTEVIIGYTNGKVTSVLDQSGLTTYRYETNKTIVTNGVGDETAYHYANLGGTRHIVKIEQAPVNGVVQSISFGYDADGNIITVTDGKGNVTRRRYDANGNLLRELNADGGLRTYTYDSQNNLLTESSYYQRTSSIDTLPTGGQATKRYVYDVENGVNTGRLRFTVNASGHVSEVVYHTSTYNKALVKETRSYAAKTYSLAGLTATDTFSEAQLVSWVSGLTGSEKQQVELTTYDYDVNGNLSYTKAFGAVDASGNGILNTQTKLTRYTYDQHGRHVQTRDESANWVTLESYAYDGLNRITRSVSKGVSTSYEYIAGEVISTRTGDGYRVRTLIDARGREVFRIDNEAASHSNWRLKNYEYDAAGRIFQVQAVGRPESFTYYNSAGQVSYTVDGAGAVVGYEYDANAQLVKATAFAERIDISGLLETTNISALVNVTHSDNRVTRHVYDKAQQRVQTKVEDDANSKITHYSYSADSLLEKVTQQANSANRDDDRTRELIYSADGSLWLNIGPESDLVLHEYDGIGRKVTTKRTSTGGSGDVLSTHYFYDAQGRQVGIVDEQGFLTETIFEPGLRKTSTLQYLNPVTVAAGETLAAVRSRALVGDNNILRTEQNFDEHGRLLSKVASDGSTTRYFYDNIGRLVRTAEQLATEKPTEFGTLDLRVEDKDLWSTSSSWLVQQGGTSSSGTGPSSGFGGSGAYAYLETSSGHAFDAGDVATFESAAFFTSGATLSFNYHMYGANMGTLAVDVLHEGKWQQVWSKTGQQQISNDAAWAQQSLDLSAYDGSIKIRFRGIAVGGYRGDMAIDNVKVQSAAAYANRATHTQYNIFGDVVGVVNGEGAAGLGANPGASTLTTAIAGNGQRFEYDNLGRKVAELGANGQKTLYFYDEADRLTYTVNAKGEYSRTEYNAFGQIKSTRIFGRRLNNTVLTEVMAAGGGGDFKISDKIWETSLDNVITHGYTRRGQLKSTIDAMQRETIYAYDEFGSLSSLDSLTRKEVYRYDQLGRRTFTDRYVDADNYVTSETRYNGLNRVTAQVDPLGRVTNHEYFTNGREILVSIEGDTAGRSTTTTYDALGRVLKVKDGAGRATTYTYNIADRSQTVTSEGGVSVTTWFNQDGQKLAIDDGNGNLTYYTYTLDGQLDTVKDALGNVVKDHDYDTSGRLLEVKDAKGSITRYNYDAVDRVLDKTVDYGKENLSTTYTYTARGELDVVTKGAGTLAATMTIHTYHADGKVRLVGTPMADGSIVATQFEYDQDGNVVRMAKGSFPHTPEQYVVAYAYDKLGRKTLETVDPDGLSLKTAYAYDDAGNLSRVTDHYGNHTWYAYDAANRLTHTIDPTGAVTEQRYDNSDQAWTSIRYHNKASNLALDSQNKITFSSPFASAHDRTTLRVYNNDGRQTYIITDTGDGKWAVKQSLYDANGNIIESRHFANTLTDAAIGTISGDGRISAAEMESRGFTGSAAGTRKTRYAYDANNRLRFTVDAENYVTENRYDAAGNLRFKIAYGKAYTGVTAESALHSALKDQPNKRTTEYQYDSAGRQVVELSDAFSGRLNDGTQFSDGRVQTKVAYNDLNQVVSRTVGVLVGTALKDAQTTKYEYDKAGRQIKTTLPGYYNSSQTKITNSSSGAFARTIEVSYDALGNAVMNKIRVGAGSSDYVYEYKTYDAAGRLSYEVNALGYATRYSIISGGIALGKVTNRYDTALSSAVLVAIDWTSPDASAKLADALGASGASTRSTLTAYDKAGRKVEEKTIADGGAYFASSLSGNAAQVPSSGTPWPAKEFEYNSFGDLIAEKTQVKTSGNDQWAETRTSYDKLGRVVLQSQKNHDYGSARDFWYVTKTRYNGLNEVEVREYANKQFAAAPPTSPTTSAKDRITRYVSDKRGLVTKVFKDNISYASYNGTSWQDHNRVNSVLMSETGYNAFGEAESQTDAHGSTTTRTFNKLGQLQVVWGAARAVAKEVDLTSASTANDPFRAEGSTSGQPLEVFQYNWAGQVVLENRNGDTTEYRYDIAGNQVQTIDGEGNVTDIYYDARGNAIEERQSVSVSDADNADVAYSHEVVQKFFYDASGRQIASTYTYDDTPHDDTASANTQAGVYKEYNGFGEVVTDYRIWGSSTDSLQSMLGNTAKNAKENSYIYDGGGRLLRSQGANGYVVYYHDLAGNVTRTEKRSAAPDVRDLTPRVTEVFYDLQGNALVQRTLTFETTSGKYDESVENRTPTIKQEFDRWGNVIKRTDAANQVSHYTYDHNNQLLTEKGPESQAWKTGSDNISDDAVQSAVTRSLTYNLAGQQATETFTSTSSALTETRKRANVYDNVGQLIKTVDASGKTEEFRYDTAGNKVATRSGSGIVNIYTYNKNSQQTGRYVLRAGTSGNTPYLSGSTSGSARAVKLAGYAYDQTGRLHAEYNGAGDGKFYHYDARGNLTKSINLVGGTKLYQFDELGRKTSEKDVLSLGAISSHDSYGNPIYENTGTSIKTNEQLWTYSKDDFKTQQLTSRTVAGATYSYIYNGFGELTKETTGLNSVEYTYYNNGLRRSVHEKVGSVYNTSWYKYDIRGLKTSESHSTSSGAQTILYHYDQLGRLSEMKSNQGTMRLYQTRSETADLQKLEYRYDEWGNRRAIRAEYQYVNSSANHVTTEYFTYDKEGRVTVASRGVLNGAIAFPYMGATRYSYNDDGLVYKEEVVTSIGDYGTVANTQESINTYNDLNLVSGVRKQAHSYKRDSTSVPFPSTPSSSGAARFDVYQYDDENRGYRRFSNMADSGRRTYTSYRKDGRIAEQTTIDENGKRISLLNDYGYDGFGNITKYSYNVYKDGVYQFENDYSYGYKSTLSGWQVDRITVKSSQGGTGVGDTTNTYDWRGRLVHARVTSSYGGSTGDTYHKFGYDTEGKMLGKSVDRHGYTTLITESYYYANGAQAATITHDSADISPLDLAHRGGNSPSTVTVGANDTLASIAQAVFGDSSLWYVLADANGLAMGPHQAFDSSEVGRALNIPNASQSVKNDSSTFKPYNPGEMIGDLTPDPTILPPPKKSCNALATIVMVAVAAVVTIYTAGAAAGLLGAATAASGAAAGTIAGTMAAGMTTLAGGAAFSLATVGAAAIGGFAGSAASQLAGKEMGVVDSFSLRQAVGSGLTAGFAAGVGGALQSAGWATTGKPNIEGIRKLSLEGQLARGAASYLGGQGSNLAAGVENHFNWTDLAISGLTPGLGGAPGVADGSANVLNNFAQNMWGATVNSSLSRLFGRGDSLNSDQWGMMAADAFGNALGSSFAHTVADRSAAQQRSQDWLQEKTAAMVETEVSESQREFNAKVERETGQKIANNEPQYGMRDPGAATRNRVMVNTMNHFAAMDQVGRENDVMQLNSAARDRRLEQHEIADRQSWENFRAGRDRIAQEGNYRYINDPERAAIAEANAWRNEYVQAENAATAWKTDVSIGFAKGFGGTIDLLARAGNSYGAYVAAGGGQSQYAPGQVDLNDFIRFNNEATMDYELSGLGRLLNPTNEAQANGYFLSEVAQLAAGGASLVSGARGLRHLDVPNGTAPSGLVHMAPKESVDAIRKSGTLGRVGMPSDIYAGPASNADVGPISLTLRTGLDLKPSGAYKPIYISNDASKQFKQVTPIGPFTTWHRYNGTQYTDRGVLNYTTGEFTRYGINRTQATWNALDVTVDATALGTAGYYVFGDE